MCLHIIFYIKRCNRLSLCRFCVYVVSAEPVSIVASLSLNTCHWKSNSLLMFQDRKHTCYKSDTPVISFHPNWFFFFYHRTLTSLANFNFLYSSCRCEKVGFAVTLQHHHSALSTCSLAYYRTEGCAMIIARHIEEGSFRLCGSGLWLKGKIKSLLFSIFFLHFSFDPDPELDCSHPVEGNHLWTSILVLLSLRWVKTLCGPLGHTSKWNESSQ